MEQLQSHIWLTASSYMGKYFRISSCIRKPFLIYHFATAPLWISLYMNKNFIFFFISVRWFVFDSVMRCQGRGSVLTEKGDVEMDAMIMDGDTLNCGAVGCVGTVKNPIKLARYWTLLRQKFHRAIKVVNSAHSMDRSPSRVDSLENPPLSKIWSNYPGTVVNSAHTMDGSPARADPVLLNIS